MQMVTLKCRVFTENFNTNCYSRNIKYFIFIFFCFPDSKCPQVDAMKLESYYSSNDPSDIGKEKAKNLRHKAHNKHKGSRRYQHLLKLVRIKNQSQHSQSTYKSLRWTIYWFLFGKDLFIPSRVSMTYSNLTLAKLVVRTTVLKGESDYLMMNDLMSAFW